MKRKIGGFILCLAVATAVSGCTTGFDEEEKVEAKGEKSFEFIQKEELNSATTVYEVKHKKTGCHYLMTDFSNDHLIQMFQADGKPYCTGGS